MKPQLLLFFICGLLLQAPPAAAAGPDTPVSVVRATLAPVYDEIPLTGSVESRRVSQLSPKLAGFVAEVLVEEGDHVTRGDPLLRLDPVIAGIELDRARADLREAEARLAEARRQRDEAAELVEKKHIPSTNYEELVSQVAIAEAALQRLQADLARQRERLQRHTVRAPFDGVIGARLVEAGQWVETGTGLFRLVEFDVLRIDVPVPQYYFTRIDVGTPVSVQFDALPEYRLQEEVSRKIPVGSESGRTFPIRIEFANPGGRIAPGMSARVRVRIGSRDQSESLLLPRDTIVRQPGGGSIIWLVDQDDGSATARRVEVKTGRSFKGNVEILGGAVGAGDLVVIRGNEILEPGQKVRIQREVEMEI